MKIHRRILAAMTALALAVGMIFCCSCSESEYTASDAKAFWDTIEETPLEDFEYEYSGNSYTILRYNGNDEIVKIPAEIEGYPVIKLLFSGVTSMSVFEDNSVIKKVYIPENVKSIALDTFKNCSSLTEVYLPATYYFEINSNNRLKQCFEGCTSLTDIIIAEDHPDFTVKNGVLCTKPDSPKYNSIGTAAVQCLIESEAVTIPEDISVISNGAYAGCGLIESVTIPSYVKSVGCYAFCGCENLSSVTISEGVEEIWLSAFERCPNLKEIKLPSSVTSIGGHFDYINSIDYINDSVVITYNGKEYSHEDGYKALKDDIGANS